MQKAEKCALLNRKNIRRWVIVAEILFLILICFFHALEDGHYVDFYPINGTFQNYNPVRRLLSGQIPFADFQDYLGTGHLYTGALFTLLFGGDYQASLVAFSFLSVLSFALIAIAIGYAILGRMDGSLALTNLGMIVMLLRPNLLRRLLSLPDKSLWLALEYAFTTGNSARFVRGMILPLLLLAFGLILRRMRKADKQIEISPQGWLFAAFVGLAAGSTFVWSNDYGICCWICLAVLSFWSALARSRRLGVACVALVIELLASLLGILIAATLVSGGHLLLWLDGTMGTGGYQSWYFNSDKSYYFYNIDGSLLINLQALVALVYMILLFVRRADRDALQRFGLPGLANMCGFCAANAYKLISGGVYRELALTILFFTLLMELTALIFRLARRIPLRTAMVALSLLLCPLWIAHTAVSEQQWQCAAHRGEYVAQMGGNMTELQDSLKSASRFLNGEAVFAAYASAQEVMEGKFQPSGSDYIIHVLGDANRERYLDAFRTGEFRYVSTIRKDYSRWEYWVECANWFFYRELYANWHPVYENEYECYWERNGAGEDHIFDGDVAVRIERIDGHTLKLAVQADESVSGVADVWLDYSIDSDGALEPMLFHRMLKVANTGAVTAADPEFESNYLRKSGAEYVPVPVENGYGELTLSAYPARHAALEINEATCGRIFTVMQEVQIRPDAEGVKQ